MKKKLLSSITALALCLSLLPAAAYAEDHTCADEDQDHWCNFCESLISQCADEDGDHYCDVCWANMPELCEDEDHNHWCDSCGMLIEGVCHDGNNDHFCDNEACGNRISECEECDEDEDNVCDLCGEGIYPNAGELNIETVAGDGTITVTWDALEDAGEDKVASYTVYCCLEETFEPLQQFVYEPGSESYSHTFTGLENDVVYDVSVDAVYTQIKEGFEDPFSVTATDTVTALPGAPTILSAGGVNGFVTVEWEAPENKGFPDILYYVITAEQNDIGFGIEVEATGEETMRCTLDDLLNGQTYQIYVSAVNEIGQGAVATTDVSPYELVVGGVAVTAANMDDVLKDGTVSFDPETMTLTLNGADITSGYAYKAGRVAGIYADGDLNIELGEAESSVTASADDTATESYGIFARGDLSISGSGSLTATAGAVEGTSVLSAGICVTGDLTLNSGSVTATGKKAEAVETGLGFSAGVYTAGDLVLEGGSLTATAGIAKGYSAQSSGIFTEGAFTMYDGSLTADGGSAAAASTAEGAYATSVGIFIAGAYSMWDGSATAKGGNANGPAAYSTGVAAKGDLSLHDGSLTATGDDAEGGYALSAGIEVASLDEEAYLNLAVYSGYLEATGGKAVGVTEAESAGVYAERSGLYIYGGEDGTPVIKLKGGSASVTSEKEADEPYASSNGIYMVAGDVDIYAGIVTITGGSWEGTDGDGWAIYARADVEYDEEGNEIISGGNVTIDCTEIALIPSPGHGFTGTRVILAGIDDDNGYAVYAGNSITIGDALAISDPEGGIIYTTDWGDMILESAEEGASPAKSVTIGLQLHKVSFVIDGSSYSSAADIPHGMSLNEAYASMIEEAGKTDFSELLNTKKDGYTFLGFYTDSGDEYDFDTAVSEDMTLTAKWSRNSSSTGGGGGTYTITVEDATNGTVKADRTRSSYGTTVKLTVAPDTGYTLETLTVTTGSGKEIELTNKGDGKYTFKMPSSKVTIKATFMDDNTMLNFFVDVPAGAYYYDAVLWAAGSGITSGTTATTFSPGDPCTRAQMAAFLWRAAGFPEPVRTSNPFVDIPTDAYYAKAVQWAYEQGITGGTSATTFSPDATCTRGQMATFLSRMADGKPVNDKVIFADIKADAYYAKAVQWAYEQKITAGTSATTFSPDDPCTRAQMVTFLYRYFVKE